MVRSRRTSADTNHMRACWNLTILTTIRPRYFCQQHTVAAGGILNRTVSSRAARNVEFYIRVQVHVGMKQGIFVGPTEPKDLAVVDRDLKVDFSISRLAGKLRFCVQVAVVDRPLTKRGCCERMFKYCELKNEGKSTEQSLNIRQAAHTSISAA